MNYKALYRTYRPTSFDQVIGQDHVVKTLVNLIKMNKISHGYLFSGPRGTGKTSIARIFANALNCIHSEKPEEICKRCIENSNKSLDIIEIDAASNNSVNDVRIIREQVGFAPTNSPYKIYIIDEVHMLTKSAFNALLMTLEEPPKHAIFIFATTNPDSIPDTILSRVQKYNFKRITKQDLKDQLEFIFKNENIKCDEESYEIIANLANGSLRDALSIADQISAYTNSNININSLMEIFGLATIESQILLINLLAKKSISEALDYFNNLVENGVDISKLLNSLINILKDYIIYKKTNNLTLVNSSYSHLLENIILDVNATYKLLDIIIDLVREIKYSDIPQQLVQLGIIKICSLDELLMDLEKTHLNINNENELDYIKNNVQDDYENNNYVRDITEEYFETQNLTQPNDFKESKNEIEENQDHIISSIFNDNNIQYEQKVTTDTKTMLADFSNRNIKEEFNSIFDNFSIEDEMQKIKEKQLQPTNQEDTLINQVTSEFINKKEKEINKEDNEFSNIKFNDITQVIDIDSTNDEGENLSHVYSINAAKKNDVAEKIINDATEILNMSNEYGGNKQEINEALLNNFDNNISKQIYDTNEINISDISSNIDYTQVVNIENQKINSNTIETTKEFDILPNINNNENLNIEKLSQSNIINLFLLSKKDTFPIFKKKLEEASLTNNEEYDSFSILLKETRFICSANDFILVSSKEDWVINDLNLKSNEIKFKKFIKEYFGSNIHFYSITKDEYINSKELFEELKKNDNLPKAKPLDKIDILLSEDEIKKTKEINDLETKSKFLFGNIFTRKKE